MNMHRPSLPCAHSFIGSASTEPFVELPIKIVAGEIVTAVAKSVDPLIVTADQLTVTADPLTVTADQLTVTVPAVAPCEESCCDESTDTLAPLSPVQEQLEVGPAAAAVEFTESATRDALAYLMRLALADPELLHRTARDMHLHMPTEPPGKLSYDENVEPSLVAIGAMGQVFAGAVCDRLDHRYCVTTEVTTRVTVQGKVNRMIISDIRKYHAVNPSGVLADDAHDIM